MNVITMEVNGEEVEVATIMDTRDAITWVKEHESCEHFDIAFHDEEMYIFSFDHDLQHNFFYTIPLR